MNTVRAAYATVAIVAIWVSTATAISEASVSDRVSMTIVIAAAAATVFVGVWSLFGGSGPPPLPVASSPPSARPSSPVSIVTPVEVVNDGEEDRVLNCFESAGTDQDWTLDALLEEEGADEATPATMDLRADWWTVGNQGSTGSCVGWACADSMLRWHFVKSGKLEQDELLSVRYVWMASKETDRFTSRPTAFLDRSGTSIKAAVDIARKYGVATEADLGFRVRETSSLTSSAFYARAAEFRIGSYINLFLANESVRPGWWRYWLANHGPILTRLDVDDAFRARTPEPLTSYEHTGPAGHAVALVGYDADGVIIRNSWGAGWGDDGFKHATWSYAMAAFTDAYGVRL